LPASSSSVRDAGALRPASDRGPRPGDTRRAPAPGATAPLLCRLLETARRPALASTSAFGAACARSDPSASATSGSLGKRCCACASGAWICGRSPRSCSSPDREQRDQLAGPGAPRDLRVRAGLRRAGERRAIGDARSAIGEVPAAGAASSVSISSTSSSASWRCASATSRRSSAWA
jgi:hypothetical protein